MKNTSFTFGQNKGDCEHSVASIASVSTGHWTNYDLRLVNHWLMH